MVNVISEFYAVNDLTYNSLAAHSSISYTAKALTILICGVEAVLQPTVHEGHLNAEGFSFGIVASRWNEFISGRLLEGALDALKRLGANEDRVAVYRVPGAFEIPLLAFRLAKSRKFDAIVCLGTIIRGQTPHFDYIANEVAQGISRAGLDSGVPVVFGIVTADTVDQAIDRAGVKLGNKGFEAAVTAVELVNLYKEAFEEG